MSRALALSRALSLGVGLFVLGLTLTAGASHYRLSQVDLLTDAEREVLARAEVATTLTLFERAAATEARKELARVTGLGFARLTELATQCDLLRISGVGPGVVRLLQAAGVRHSADLKSRGAARLHQEVVRANRAQRIREVLPDVQSLAAWMASARELPRRLEGVR